MVQFDASQGTEFGANCTGEVLVGWCQCRSQDDARLLFHRAAVLCCADTQSTLQALVKITYYETGHNSSPTAVIRHSGMIALLTHPPELMVVHFNKGTNFPPPPVGWEGTREG